MFWFSVENEKPLKKEQVPKINQGLACEYHYLKKSKELFSTSSHSGTDIVLGSSNTGSPTSWTYIVNFSTSFTDATYKHQVVCPYRNESSSNFLHCWEIKRIESLDEHLTGNVHNIENNVIHNWHKICITSKTMLYTSVTKCV